MITKDAVDKGRDGIISRDQSAGDGGGGLWDGAIDAKRVEGAEFKTTVRIAHMQGKQVSACF